MPPYLLMMKKEGLGTSQLTNVTGTFSPPSTTHFIGLDDTIGTLNVVIANVYNASGGNGSINYPISEWYQEWGSTVQLNVGPGEYIGTYTYSRVFQPSDVSSPTILITLGNASPMFVYVLSFANHGVTHTSGKPDTNQILVSTDHSISNVSSIDVPAITSTVDSEIVRFVWKYANTSTNTDYPPVNHISESSNVNAGQGGSYFVSRLSNTTSGIKPLETFTSDTATKYISTSIAVPR